MGFSTTASHAIFVVALVSAFTGGTQAWFGILDDVDAATDARDARFERALGSRAYGTFCYNDVTLLLTTNATNDGVEVDLDETQLVVDGAVTPWSTAVVADAPTTNVWRSGETAFLNRSSQATAPTRVALALPSGVLVHLAEIDCPQLSTIVVTPSSSTVAIGGTQDYSAAGFDQFGDPWPVASFSWSTTAGTIVQLTSSTARLTAGTVAGAFVVQATSGGVTGTATVTVPPGPPAALTVTPTPVEVPAGGTQAFTATVLDAYGNVNATAPISWSTTAGSITAGGVLTAQTTAQAGRSVTATTTGGVSGQASVNVGAAAVDTIVVSPSSATVYYNRTQQLSATAYDAYGNVNSSVTIAWSTTAGAVSQSGLFTAGSASTTATVTASAAGKSGTATMTVARGAHVEAMASYKSGVPSDSFRKGTDTVEIRTTVRDHEGALVQGASVTVEFVDSNGNVKATRTSSTNASGVASASYALPSNAAQGGWTARVTTIGGTGIAYDSAANVVSSDAFTVTT